MPSLLAQGLPTHVHIAGELVAINTDFRAGINYQRTLAANISDAARVQAMLTILYQHTCIDTSCKKHHVIDSHVLKHSEEALRAGARFHVLGIEQTSPEDASNTPLRIVDWDYDDLTVVADFKREYDLDLTDSSLSLHWWTFLSLFRGLSNDSGIKTAIKYRGERPRNMSKEAQKEWNRLAEFYRLPDDEQTEQE